MTIRLTSAFLLSCCAASYGGLQYEVTDLGTQFGGNWSINDSGQIVGKQIYPGDASHPSFVGSTFRDGGTVQPLTGPHGAQAGVADLNNHGEAVGTYRAADEHF